MIRYKLENYSPNSPNTRQTLSPTDHDTEQRLHFEGIHVEFGENFSRASLTFSVSFQMVLSSAVHLTDQQPASIQTTCYIDGNS